MTIQETHRQFKLFLDKVNSEFAPEFSPTQIDVFLHEAEVRIVKQAYGRNNIYKQGYQEIQKRTDDLNTLVKVGYLAPKTYNDGEAILPVVEDGVYSFPLSILYTTDVFNIATEDTYMFYLRSKVKVTSNTISPVYTGVSLIPQDKLQEVVKDPFNISVISEPIVFFEDNCIKVDTNNSSFIPQAIRLTYLKYPTKVSYANSIDSELPEEKQRESLQLAVLIALESVESARVNTQASMLNTLE